MKKILMVLALSALVVPAYAKVLVGKVDVQKVLLNVNDGVEVRSKLKKVFDSKQELLKKEEEKIRKAQQDYEKQKSVLNDKAREAKERDIQGLIDGIQKQTMEYQKEITDMENKAKGPILEKVKAIVDEVSKKADVDVTFEASTAPVIYAKEEKDLTQEVIDAYNKKYPKK